MNQTKRKLCATLCAALIALPALSTGAAAASHSVAPGDTMWKLAVKYQVGTREIITANPQVTNPDLIYPGQQLQIPEANATVSAYEAQVVRLVNAARAQSGLSPLSAHWELSRVARYKSQDMVDKHYFSHTSPTYGSPYDMIRAFGLTYRAAGENIAYGPRTPQAVVDMWLNSPGHRANIMNRSFTQIGVGYVTQGNYWTQLFIG